MIEINRLLAPLLVAAIRDAIKYNEALVPSSDADESADAEECLCSLGILAGEVQRQYEKLAEGEAQMPPFSAIWP